VVILIQKWIAEWWLLNVSTTIYPWISSPAWYITNHGVGLVLSLPLADNSGDLGPVHTDQRVCDSSGFHRPEWVVVENTGHYFHFPWYCIISVRHLLVRIFNTVADCRGKSAVLSRSGGWKSHKWRPCMRTWTRLTKVKLDMVLYWIMYICHPAFRNVCIVNLLRENSINIRLHSCLVSTQYSSTQEDMAVVYGK